MDAVPEPDQAQKRKRAIIRLVLGQAQMLGATVTLVLLFLKGVCPLVIGGVIVTGLVSVTSRLLFGKIWKEKPRH
jgi:hypothetical protein